MARMEANGRRASRNSPTSTPGAISTRLSGAAAEAAAKVAAQARQAEKEGILIGGCARSGRRVRS